MKILNVSFGSCIITGTAFLMPIFANVKFIKEKEERPSSDNVDLLALWAHKNFKENEFDPLVESSNEVKELKDIK
jgi:uncharacterized protein